MLRAPSHGSLSQRSLQEPVAYNGHVANVSLQGRMPGMSRIPLEVSADLGSGSARLTTPRGHASMNKDSIKIDMEIRLPPQPAKQKKTRAHAVIQTLDDPPPASILGLIIREQRSVEPQYFQNVDCVGVPSFFSPVQCRQIIEVAEEQGFVQQRRHRLLDIQWTDLVDGVFAKHVWERCGLAEFLSSLTVDGMVPCGLNDVIRIQKYVEGSVFGRHTDQCIERSGDRASKYSLRVFLNGRDEFEGGLSAFHVPFRSDPVVFAPETGLALLYPQGQHCTVQEEQQVLEGVKYVLRADILFAPQLRW